MCNNSTHLLILQYKKKLFSNNKNDLLICYLFFFNFFYLKYIDHLSDLVEQQSDCSNDLPYIITDGLNGTNISYLESPDDLMEESFEEALKDVVNEEDLNSFLSIEAMNTQNLTKQQTNSIKSDLDFTDLAKHGIIEMAGDDLVGRKIIAIYACKLPPNNTIDHDKLLK